MYQDIFYKLQQPTMALIRSLYQLPADIKNLFIDMMAIYEQNPTEETGKILFDKVTGPESPEEKKAWFIEKAKNVPLEIRHQVEKEYIQYQKAVPKGLPTSDILLVGMEIIKRSDQNALMNAQAAARILNNIEHPENIKLINELFNEDKKGNLSEARTYLNKSFSTQIQQLEHLSAILVGWRNQKTREDLDMAPVYRELTKVAVLTFYQVADVLSDKSIASEIRNLAASYAPREDVETWSIKPIIDIFKEVLADIKKFCLNYKEWEVIENLITKRLNQISQEVYDTKNTAIDTTPEK